MTVSVKICGINDQDAIDAAVDGGADMVGFVFYPPSPRVVTPDFAADLADTVPDEIEIVGLFVDADDVTFDRVLANLRLEHDSMPRR